MSGRVTRQRQRDGATKIPLLSPLKPAARGKRHSNNTSHNDNTNANENASTSNKRPRSPSHDPDAAQHDAKRVKQQQQPLSPKNDNGADVPAIELPADAMAVDSKPQPPSQSQLQPPKTPGRLFVSGSPQRTLARTPGTVSRLPRPLFKSSAAPSLAKTPRGLFQSALGTTPARPKGPLTRGANIRRYKQPVPTKKPEPKVEVGSPRKATGIFAKRVEGELGVPEETARETKASLSRLDEALKKLAAPRPPPRRPASSVGFASSSTTMPGSSSSSDGASTSTAVSSNKPDSLPARPGTSLGLSSPSKLPLPSSSSRRLETIPGSPTRPQLGPPRLPTFAPHSPTRSVSASATVGDERRASAAIRGLNRTLSELVPVTTSHDLSAETSSGIRSKKEGSSSAERPKLRVQPPRAPSTRVAAQREAHADPKPAKPKEKDTAPHLDVLKNCTVFVDVRTDEGDDAAALFVDMLRGLGARILTRMSTRLTHIVFKSGLPGTVARYRMLNEPRPLVVGIGWVVECVEKRARVDEDRFSVDLETAETKQKRRAGTAPLNPVRTRTLRHASDDEGEDGDGEMSLTAAEESFLEFSFEKSILGVGVPPSAGKQKEIRDFFAPVERASSSKRAFRPGVGSPLRETFALPDDDEDDDAVAAKAKDDREVETVQS